ncbi:hypothetical protein E8E12_004539 [Didymella heteroderae]|uniref:TauD/TfdA-like domain-containing protein n=1 Tax=Didymella heteroderae TaxID=1769908 RepID=A0A9P5C385_9PLEO|nr:hypothetical protein E8E12_004539 [Didymella heteroderae]
MASTTTASNNDYYPKSLRDKYRLHKDLTSVIVAFGQRPAYHKRPLLFNHDGNIIMNFSRCNLTGAYHTPRSRGLPGMTEAQAEALDAAHFLAEKHQLKMTMAPGDLRFFNNLILLHRRDSFCDDEGSTRHIMRIWLRNGELTWDLPEILELDRCFAENEDLIKKVFSYLPEDVIKVPMLKTQRSCS